MGDRISQIVTWNKWKVWYNVTQKTILKAETSTCWQFTTRSSRIINEKTSQVAAMLIISMTTTKQWEKSVGQRRRFWIQTKWYQNVQILGPSTISDRSHVAFIGHLLFLV